MIRNSEQRKSSNYGTLGVIDFQSPGDSPADSIYFFHILLRIFLRARINTCFVVDQDMIFQI
jgi:hypothetical protein